MQRREPGLNIGSNTEPKTVGDVPSAPHLFKSKSFPDRRPRQDESLDGKLSGCDSRGIGNSVDDLHLHLDGPDQVKDAVYGSAGTVSYNGHREDHADDDETDNNENIVVEDEHGRTPTIRFRSRVRITSGIHRHSHHLFQRRDSQSLDIESTLSSSPSSSISAPLKTRRGSEHERQSGWAPLGRRIGLLAEHNNLRRQRRRMQLGLDSGDAPSTSPAGIRARIPNERTPLVPSPYFMPDNVRAAEREYDSDDDEEAWYSEEVDRLFGTWPGRLLNRHWWWWQLEPIWCCHRTGYDDDDRF